MADLVPVLDLEPWHHGGAGARAAVAQAANEACERTGFLQIVGHGLPPAVLAAMLEQTDALFALPLQHKRALVPLRPGINRGYAARASEALAYSLGQAPSAPDLFEAFNIGPDRVPDDAWHRSAPHDLFAPNIWPAQLPALRAALTDYFDAAVSVGTMLLEVFAAALGLPEQWFKPFVDRSTLTLRVNHYQRHPDDDAPQPAQMGMGAHTDYGVVTVLYADAVPGLQILAPDGNFHDVVPQPGALLVNLGDLTAQWTNDRWRSTLHRVLPPAAATRRRSAALFIDANYDAVIECLPTCRDAQHPPKYPAVVAGDHLISKLLGPRELRPSQAIDTSGGRLT